MKNLKPEEIAYIAGFIDGEGSFQVQKRLHRNKYGKWIGFSLYLEVVNTNNAVIEYLQSLINGNFFFKKTKGNRKDAYGLRFNGKDAQNIASILYDYLIVKRDIAEIILQFPLVGRAKQSLDVKEKKEELYQKAKVLNRRGLISKRSTTIAEASTPKRVETGRALKRAVI